MVNSNSVLSFKWVLPFLKITFFLARRRRKKTTKQWKLKKSNPGSILRIVERRTALYITQGAEVQASRGPYIKGATPEDAQTRDMMVLGWDWKGVLLK